MGSVEVRKIQKSFGATKVIHEMDLAIAASEFLVLVGPSGCGKSTLLRMIAGLEAPTSGDVLIDGTVVNDLSPKERGVAMVFQNYALYPHMTVRQNMAFSLKLSKLPPAEIDRRVDEAAKILGIEEQLAKKPGQLSGGQKQRVAMGRAMVRQPKLFLFDEPLSNLDAQLRVKMRAEISLLHRRIRSTVIYVTHDQVEAMTLADRIAVLHQGRIEQIGTPLELYSNPRTKFVAGFIGTPAMNFLPSEKAGTRWVGVRPEHVTLGGAGQTLLRGKVQLVEPLGGLSHVHVFDGKNTLVVETRDATPALDSDVTVMAPAERLYYFDESERRV